MTVSCRSKCSGQWISHSRNRPGPASLPRPGCRWGRPPCACCPYPGCLRWTDEAGRSETVAAYNSASAFSFHLLLIIRETQGSGQQALPVRQHPSCGLGIRLQHLKQRVLSGQHRVKPRLRLRVHRAVLLPLRLNIV